MEFRSYRSFHEFARSVRHSWRYALDDEQRIFLETLLDTSKDKHEIIPESAFLWRAQLGHYWKEEDPGEDYRETVPCPFSSDRMKPRADRACEGRANPKGIPYLYLATEQQTAIAEVRPWIGSYVSVAKMRVRHRLKVVNFTTDDEGQTVYFGEPDSPERERQVWRDVDRAFAEPVTRSNSNDFAEYVPTQIIAELFRKHSFDGLAYRSSLGSGHNIIVFDLDAVEVESCSLVQIKNISLEFRQAANPYFVRQNADRA